MMVVSPNAQAAQGLLVLALPEFCTFRRPCHVRRVETEKRGWPNMSKSFKGHPYLMSSSRGSEGFKNGSMGLFFRRN